MSPLTGRDRPGLPVLVAAVSTVVLVAAVVLAVVMSVKLHHHDQQQAERADALAAGEQFALRMDAFDGGNMGKYVRSIKPLLTTKQQTLFTQQLQKFSQVYAATRQAGGPFAKPGQGRIVLSGVVEADPDSATLLVAHDSTIPGQAAALHFRWQLTMRKVAGRWLVDDFTPVT